MNDLEIENRKLSATLATAQERLGKLELELCMAEAELREARKLIAVQRTQIATLSPAPEPEPGPHALRTD